MLKRSYAILICWVFVIGLLGCETSPLLQKGVQTKAVIKSPIDTREYATLTLDNQMEVILVQDASSEIAAVSLAVGVGSFQNPPQQQGLAHYLEHMLFLGTEKYPEPNTLQQFVDHNSGSWNAYTATDHTNYFFSLPTSKLDTALDMFSDYFKAPKFDLEYSEKELNAVNSEWSMGRSQDGRIINYLNGLTANPAHPVSQLSVGNLETLGDKPGSILNDELVAFFNRYYSANIMKLVMVSNLSIEQQKAMVNKHFDGVKDKKIDPPAVNVSGMTQKHMGKKIHYASVMDLKMLMLHFPMPNNLAKWKSKPNAYVVNLLASEEPGTVAQQLREQNLVKALYANVEPKEFDYDGSFNVYADLTDLGIQNRDKVIAAIFAYIELIKADGIDEKFFLEQRAIKAKKFANTEMQAPLKTAIRLSSTLLNFEAKYIIAHPYIYEEFDQQSIADVLSILTPERARIWYISQDEPANSPIPYHEGAYAIESITAADIERWQSLSNNFSFNLPAENDLFSEQAAAVVPPTIIAPKQLVDKTGVEIWLAHSENFQGQKGKVDIVVNSSLFDVSVKQQMLGKLFAKILQSQELSLIDRAQSAGIGLQFSFKGTDFVISLSEFNAKHRLLVDRVVNKLKDWQVSGDEFEKARDSLRQDLLNREKSPPFRQMFGLLQRELLEHSWSRDAEKRVVDALTRDDIKTFYRQLLQQSRVRIFAYGNYSEASVTEIASLVKPLLPKGWEAMTAYRRPIKTPTAGKSLSYSEALSGHTDNALVELFVAPEPTYLIQAQMQTLNALTKNSFFTQLRTNEQLGYVVGSSPQQIRDYTGLMLFVQSNTTDLPAIKARIDRFREEFLAELEATDPTIIAQIVDSQVEHLTKKPADYHEEMRPLLSDFYDVQLNYDSQEKLIEAYKLVNKAGLLTLYKNVILGDGGMGIVVQLKGTQFADTAFAKTE